MSSTRPAIPRVSAAVLNFNGRALLEVVLPTLAAQEFEDVELIVVDDCSSDDSVEYLKREWPQVRVVPTGESNVGVAAALNVAVRVARGEFVALLNNDIELDPRWLGELVAALDRHPEAASAAGKLLRFDRRDLIDSTGDVFLRSATAFGRGAGERDTGQYEREEEVFAPTGGAALYRSSALAAVGPFDESFYAYFEDVDWGLRAQLAGHRSRYVPGAVGYHMGSQTTKPKVNVRFFELQHRNTVGVVVKGVPIPFILRNARHILAYHLLSFAYSARVGLLIPHLRGLARVAPRLPEWLSQRGRILGARPVSRTEFERFVSDGRAPR